MIACIGLNKDVIVSERNDIVKQKNKFFWNFLRYYLYKYSWKITTNTIKNKNILKKYLKVSNIFYVPNLIRKKPKISQNISIDRDFLLAVGRLDPQKNYEFLIKCFYKANLKKLDLIIIGEGKERRKLENLIEELNLCNKVKLIGNVQNPYPYYKLAKGFLMVSNYEGSQCIMGSDKLWVTMYNK